MSYKDRGYSKYITKSQQHGTVEEYTEDASSQAIPTLSGAPVAGGKTTSSDGKIVINWDIGQILISDGANYRILIGNDGL